MFTATNSSKASPDILEEIKDLPRHAPKAGGYYLTRTGRLVGPLKELAGYTYSFWCGELKTAADSWMMDGGYFGMAKHNEDLVLEILLP